ncbi:MAG: hypothetical protein KC502_12935 [Myxococcales bacterium]|nr:hypothetical protein [Myxococcales bacterium]
MLRSTRTFAIVVLVSLLFVEVAHSAIIRRALLTKKGGRANYQAVVLADGADLKKVDAVRVTVGPAEGVGETSTFLARRKGKNPGAATFFGDFDRNSEKLWNRVTTTPLDGTGHAIGLTRTMLVRAGGGSSKGGKLVGPTDNENPILVEGELVNSGAGWRISATVGGDTSLVDRAEFSFADDRGATRGSLVAANAKGEFAVFRDQDAPFKSESFVKGRTYEVEVDLIGADGETLLTSTIVVTAAQ